MDVELQLLYQGLLVHHLERDEIEYELAIRAVQFDHTVSESALRRRLRDRLREEKEKNIEDMDFGRRNDSVDAEIGKIDAGVKNIRDYLENRVRFEGIRDSLKTRLAHYFARCSRAQDFAEKDEDLIDLDKLKSSIRSVMSTFFSLFSPNPAVQAEIVAQITQSISNLKMQQEQNNDSSSNSPDSQNEQSRETELSGQDGAGPSNNNKHSSKKGRKLKSVPDNKKKPKETERIGRRFRLDKSSKKRLPRSDSTESVDTLESESSSSSPLPSRRKYKSETRGQSTRKYRPVSDWNVRYDGKDNGQGLMKFIREVEFLAKSERVTHKELFRSAIHLFGGTAKSWFMASVENEDFSSWRELVREIKKEFLSPDHDHVSEIRAVSRKQGQKEKFQDYHFEMQKIFNSLTKPLSEAKKFEIVFRNMRSDYKGHAVASNINNLADLKKFGRQLDATFWFRYNPHGEETSTRNRAQVYEMNANTKSRRAQDFTNGSHKTRNFYRSQRSNASEDEKFIKPTKHESPKPADEREPKTIRDSDVWFPQCGHKSMPLLFKKREDDRLLGQTSQKNVQNPYHFTDICSSLPLVGYHKVVHNEYIQTSDVEVDEHFIHVSNDDRPHIEVSAYDIPLIGLLDSGANRSILGRGAQQLIQICKLKVYNTEVDVVTASGEKLIVSGYVSLPITFNGTTKLIDMLIIPSLRRRLILGSDFWKAFGIVPYIPQVSVEVVDEISEDIGLSEAQQQELEQVKTAFKASVEGQLETTTLINHRIELTEEAKKQLPVRINPFPISPARQNQINVELDSMLESGIIERSYSDWALRLVPVDKLDGSVRLCLDARKLNERTVRDSYPLPHADRILSRLGPSRYISTIDLSKAFLQIPLHPKSKKFTAFSVLGRGLFQFTRMPFGLVNSPATLSRLMDRVLGGSELEPNVFVYLDDIIVVSNTFEEHLDMLREVATRLRSANLSINLSKSQFCVSEVPYLGYILSRQGLRPNPDRVEAIVNFEKPKSLRALRRFLGMCNYYRRFIANYSAIVQPLTDLLKDKPKTVHWKDLSEKAFVKIKELLITAPILTSPDFSLPFSIHCDASDSAIAGVLTQPYEGVDKPIAYFSQKLSTPQQRYCATEKEALAVLKSLEKFRCYVEGTKFIVYTDASALTYILRSSWRTSSRLCRWSIELQRHDIEIKHRRGVDNVIPDALSRSIEVLSSTSDKSEWYHKMFKRVQQDNEKTKDFQIESGILKKFVASTEGKNINRRTR
ncbi:uncharacterized protein LOC131426604 [Malaya genurostris]|uniref:uncharacterized protein LOC131426604 n=1 Tax=Malaya genurostris TaxID=325434 RepID=UPI0026F38E83|nr:uncharacterized protein LOC131426604 [Malaya genurostris]